MTINEAIDIVISGVNDEWSTLMKIRYVYVTLGGLLQKHTDFFFSVDKKLAEKNLSLKELKDIYEDDKSEGDLKVICRSAAYILQRIYDKLGIKSELIKSNNNVIEFSEDDTELFIHHWFLAVHDDNEKVYFLTLASDLPYIQTGMQTRHFASNIPYKKVQKNGEEVQVYQGPEIKHTVLKDKELREIDKKIGYINSLYNYDEDYRPSKGYQYNYNDASLAMLTQELKSNKLYIELEERSTRFYGRLLEVEIDGKKKSLYDINTENIMDVDWNLWIRRLCKYVQRKIENVIEYRIFTSTDFYSLDWNYETWIHEVCLQLQRYLYQFVSKTDDSLYVQEKFLYSKWSRQMKNAIKDTYKVFDVDNVLMILDKCNVLVSGLLAKSPNAHFMNIFNSLSYHFISKSNLLETSMVDDVVSSRYITHKFKRMFKRIFGCNKEIRDLNKMEYSEQIVIIKMIIDRMFPELTKNNAGLDENYNENYSVVQNRIQIYSVKDKKEGNYALVFHIVGDETYSDTYYFYEPKANTFEIANILKIYSEYIIVSDRLKTRIEEMEDIEIEKRSKK